MYFVLLSISCCDEASSRVFLISLASALLDVLSRDRLLLIVVHYRRTRLPFFGFGCGLQCEVNTKDLYFGTMKMNRFVHVLPLHSKIRSFTQSDR